MKTDRKTLHRPDRFGCDGFHSMSRRQAITMGSLSAMGLSLGDFFKVQAADKGAFTQESGIKKEAKALSVICRRRFCISWESITRS
ncbi:MAG: hypothetical protein ACKVJU_20790 [Verrucomicrobiales bacterium]